VFIAMAGKKIKLDEEAISEILVADTDSESVSEASDFEDCLKEEEEEDQQQQKQQASAEIKTQAATSDGLPYLGTASWKEHKYSSFCESSKRCEEN
jgi:hypothetical protein